MSSTRLRYGRWRVASAPEEIRSSGWLLIKLCGPRRTKRTLLQILVFVAAIVVIGALAIWFDSGPVAHSAMGFAT